MASEARARRLDRWVFRAQVLLFLFALGFAAGQFLIGDGKRGLSTSGNAIGPIPAMPWRSHPPIDVYR